MGSEIIVDRRGFLGLGIGSVATVLAACTGLGDDERDPWRGTLLATSARLPDGVVTGWSDDGLHFVVRIEALAGPARLGFELADDAGFQRVLVRAIAEIDGDRSDIPLHVRIADARLPPGRRVFYRVRAAAGTLTAGAVTMPLAADDARDVRLGFFSCQGFPAGYYTAHAGLAREQVDAVVSLGDYIYDLTDDVGPADRVDRIAGNGLAETREEYREKYRLARSDADLRKMHAAHAMLAVWDNHELAEDGGHLAGIVPRLPLATRVRNGKDAFWDMQPMDAGETEPLFRSVRIGKGVELFLLDLHSYAGPLASGASYLGTAQLAWLLEGLARSTARWKLIASSTVMMGLDLEPGNPVNLNQWDGFPEERRAIVEHVRSRAIAGVVVLTGDLHTFLAAPVTTTGRADGDPGLVEFSAGAISSHGLLDLQPNQTGVAEILVEAAHNANAHLEYIEVLARGYAIVCARPDQLEVTFRSPVTVAQPQSPMRTLARFRVHHGSTTIQRLDPV